MLSVNIQKLLPHFLLDVNFEVDDEIIVLFGPSGSGKTTILNCVAGLTHPDFGQIKLNEQIFFGKGRPSPPQQRNIGYVFQDYALFPHLTVRKNICYGIQRKFAQMEPIVSELLQVLRIDHLLKAYPHEISGGEKQRVALARALATEPSVLLLDEPFSALDAQSRQQCQDELLRLHQRWKIPVLLVTHDQEEARKLGDRILPLHQGKIQTSSIL